MLAKIVAAKTVEVAANKEIRPLSVLQAGLKQGDFAFSKALRRTDWALIAECKLASPAKGRLCDRHSVPELADIFTRGGATALSVHTSTPFLGRLEDLADVRAVTSLPLLRKDFIIDEYQLYEARWAGADAVLLIASLLTVDQLGQFLAVADSLGLDCLVEVHSRRELSAVQQTSAAIVGINNRDLTTFKTDIATTFALLAETDGKRLIISESGIKDGTDARRLKAAGVRGILVGEGLVTVNDILTRTRELSLNSYYKEDTHNA